MPEGNGFRRRGGVLGGDYWAIATYLAVPALALLLLATALPPDAPPALPQGRVDDLREVVHDRTLSLQAWPRLLAELCRDPRLLRVGLGPSCSDGTLTLADDAFYDPDLRALRPEGERRLRIAIPILLDALRESDAIWNQLEVIEIRGHADPRALRDPYATNLQASQERSTAVLLFLTSDPQLSRRDRLDLQRLAVASGASHSRPPADCRVRSDECDDRAKRVEIRLRFDEGALRARVGEFHDELMQRLTR